MSGPRPPIDVLVVDDSAVVRQALAVLLARDAEMVVTVAADPIIARTKIKRMRPDVVVLDLEMPRMDGLTFLAELMATDPLPVVVCSGLAAPNTATALRALELGAVAVHAKPQFGIRDFLERGANDLVATIRAAAEVQFRRRSGPQRVSGATEPTTSSDPFLRALAQRSGTIRPVAIGASTGGVQAITELLAALPADAPPILVTLHMPAGFTTAFARRLDERCRLEVKEAVSGDPLREGRVLIAPGDRHLAVVRTPTGLQARVTHGPRISGHRPSVDVLFRSLREAVGAEAIGVLLTGMGEDGAQGLLDLHLAGAVTIAQDETSSIVWGMPKAAIDLGAAQKVLPLGRIAGHLLSLARPGHPVEVTPIA